MDERARRMERVERAALVALHEIAPAEARRRAGLGRVEVGGALVSIAAGVPGILLNRVVGLGVETPATRADLDAIRARYRDARVGRWLVHVHPDARPLEIGQWLVEAGLEPYRGWMKFERGAEPRAEERSDVDVGPADAGEAEAFARIVAEGFELDAPAVPLLAALGSHPGWRLYLGRIGGEPAAAGALFVDEGVALLDWAATRPEFRRRGAQGALLRRRVRNAIDLGCDLLTTVTGEAVEGDPQHSYRNILRAGFREAYPRANFVAD